VSQPDPHKPQPLYPGAVSCINSGWCCKQGPCPFGEWDAARHQCAFLTADNKCGKYDEILASGQGALSPAFGAGCCSSLNPDRAKLIVAARLQLIKNKS